MKICVININNCIDYSQYGPFLFENIKKGECVVYHSIHDSSELGEIYDEILAEYNRNAFGDNQIALVLIIGRNMLAPTAREYELYHDINIFNHITSKLDVFSEIYTIYVDDYNEKIRGELHAKLAADFENGYVSDAGLGQYFPVCPVDFTEKSEFAAAVEKIGNPMFRKFYQQVLDDIPDDLGEEYRGQMMNVFSMYCAKRLRSTEKIYQLIDKRDIADSILKKIKIVYFIKQLAKAEDAVKKYDEFFVDYEEVKSCVAAYQERLSSWLSGTSKVEEAEVTRIRVFQKLHNSGAVVEKLEKVIAEELSAFDKVDLKEEVTVEETFENLERIINNADKDLEELSKKDIEAYFDESNYFVEAVSEEGEAAKLYTEDYEKELMNQLNIYTTMSTPGVSRREALLQLLKDAHLKIEELFGCRRAYFFGSFLMTLLFACAGIAVLYFVAQYSIFIKEKTFLIFAGYNLGIAVLFFSSYAIVAQRYKKLIKKIIRDCKQIVENFLGEYQHIAADFEKNLNLMADIDCLREYLDRKKAKHQESEIKRDKLEWHRRKTRQILDNISHFDDFVKDAVKEPEKEVLTPEQFEHDEEHTDFYQVKLF